ncbi:hypothetical protein KJ909_00750 [Patescibacteria group bacterium]|nr:hypothetical protein [Patescibacteria group bacterium]
MKLPSKKLIPALFLALAIIATPLVVNQLNRTNLDTRKKATNEEDIDILEYMIPDENKQGIGRCEDNGQGACKNDRDYLSFRQNNNNLIINKWGKQPTVYEHFTWDDNFIYLKYDSSWGNSGCGGEGTSYAMSQSFWAKRKMKIGESIESVNNLLTAYKNDCTICDGPSPWKNNQILEAYYPEYDFGGDIGKKEAIVIRGEWSKGSSIYERFYYAKGWGWVKWEYYSNSSLQENSANYNKNRGPVDFMPQQKCQLDTNACKIDQITKTGDKYSVKISAYNFKATPDQARLWLETPNRTHLPLPENLGRTYADNTYYLIDQFPTDNQTHQIEVPSLPSGDYLFHCDINSSQNKCTGNPFCKHEGGQEECTGWVSCSDQDHLTFTVSATATPTSIWVDPTPTNTPLPTNIPPRPTAVPTSSTQTTVCHDQYFSKWHCDTRAPVKFPNIEATCKLDPNLGKINSNSPASAINFWKWSYCEEGQIITPTPLPDKPWTCSGQYWGYAQCYWRNNHYLLIRQGQADCRLNPNKEVNYDNLLDPINYWKWTYCTSQ